jgi:hypothetical protein
VAIIQEPPKYLLDAKGYYELDFLKKWPFRPLSSNKPSQEGEVLTVGTIVGMMHRGI